MNQPISIVSTIVFLTIQILSPKTGASQQPIVLRDLSLIRSQTISNFDRTAITLSDGTTLQWDQVLKAKLSGDPRDATLADRQTEFDGYIKQIGLPLFRLKTRITHGDWAGAGKISEPMFDSVMAGKSEFPNLDVEYLVCLATMKSRIGQGSGNRNRASAVIPFLRASSAQSGISQKTLAIVGTKRIADNREDGLSPELLPVWFDTSQIRISEAWMALLTRLEDQNYKETDLIAKAIYLASMQIELDQFDSATETMNRLNDNKSKRVQSWLLVLRARILQRSGEHVKAQGVLDRNSESIIGDARPVAIYYRGLNDFEIHIRNAKPETPLNPVIDNELSKSSLMLLRLPALYGLSHPNLAAAGLYQVVEIAKLRGHVEQSKKLSRELLQRYPRTYHGSLKPQVIGAR